MAPDSRFLPADALNSHVNPEAIRPKDLVRDHKGALFFVGIVNDENGFLSI